MRSVEFLEAGTRCSTSHDRSDVKRTMIGRCSVPDRRALRRWLQAMSWHRSGDGRFMLSFMNDRTIASVFSPYPNSARPRNTRLERQVYCSALSELSSRTSFCFSSSLILSPSVWPARSSKRLWRSIHLSCQRGIAHRSMGPSWTGKAVYQSPASVFTVAPRVGLSELNSHMWRQISFFAFIIKCACKQTVSTLPS